MPGAYAHLSIANAAQKCASTIGLREETLVSLGLHLKFIELGSVSPDYPYLVLDKGQNSWADAMHYTNNATLLRAGVKAVVELPNAQKEAATAWLLGFAAHMAADMTIHPVVELRVGPFIGNESEHRRCEMHQDAYIFPRAIDVGDTGLSEHLASGISRCHKPGDPDALDVGVEQVWMKMLDAAYPNVGLEPPRPNSWHKGFRTVLAAMASINHLFPFSRHVSTKLNLAYPSEKDIDPSYIQQLRTPEGPMDYSDIYERSISNVLAVWKGLDDALVHGRSDDLDRLEDWNLDTGRSVQSGRLVFWREAA